MTTILITSIAPPLRDGAIDDSKKSWLDLCMTSWTRSGHELLSVNVTHEADILRNIYPKINVQEVKDSAVMICNRPLVFMYDAIQIALKLNAERYAVCNSDVLIARGMPKLAPEDDACYYSCRMDVDEITSNVGTIFPGIDYFSFDPSFANDITARFFAFGLPWWDYWLPIQAVRSNRGLYRLTNPLGEPLLLHRKHNNAWNSRDFIGMGNYFLKLLANCDLGKETLHNFLQQYDRDLNLSTTNVRLFAAIAQSICGVIHASAETFSVR